MSKVFKNNSLGKEVWSTKYKELVNTIDGVKHDFVDKHMISYANQISKAGNKYKDNIDEDSIYDLLRDFKKLVLGGSIMYGLSHPKSLVSLSNCWAIGKPDAKDSYGTIMKYDQQLVHLMKRRGGVGLDLSFIRPHGSIVRNAAITSTGVVPFAKRYSNTTLEVAQDGRRGALILTLDANHRDAIDFIKSKANTSEIQGANISLKVSDKDILKIIEHDHVSSKNIAMDVPFDTEKNNFSYRTFTELSETARNFAEPGLLFWDRINEQVDSIVYGKYGYAPVGVNPCGELPLSELESCRLLSIIVSAYVKNPYTPDAEFDYEEWEKDVYNAQKIADNIVDLEIAKINNILKKLYKEKEEYGKDNNGDIEIEMWETAIIKARGGRRTGLGYMGLADAFAMMGYKYGSNESIQFSESVTKSFMLASYKSSIDMAKNRGAFEVYDEAEFDSNAKNIQTIKSLLDDEYLEKYRMYGRRNIQNLAIAPTGSISIVAGVSSSIEPIFNIRYTRRKRAFYGDSNYVVDENGNKWTETVVVHRPFIDWFNLTYKTDKGYGIISKMSDDELNEIISGSPFAESTAHEINPISKIELQAAIQKYIDASISNTLNLPEDATAEQVKEYFLYGWGLGLKGMTVYRDGSRSGVLLKNKRKEFKYSDAIKRPSLTYGKVHNIMINKNNWVVLIGFVDNWDEKNPYEIFAFKHDPINSDEYRTLVISKNKKKNYSLNYYESTNWRPVTIIDNIIEKFSGKEEEVITRLISTLLRHGVNVKWIYEQMNKVDGDITDFHLAITRVLAKYVKDKEGESCPECGRDLSYEGGCLICHSCGWSKCS